MKKIAVVLAIILTLMVCDAALTRSSLIRNSDAFSRNDFEIVQKKHPETVWDRVFFGDSAVTSGYIEEISTAQYINLGIDGASAEDLLTLLKKRHIRVGHELVIGLNYFTLTGAGKTDPTYIWHKKEYVPYIYFDCARLKAFLKGGRNENQEKQLYRGVMSESTAEEILNSREFTEPSPEKIERNLNALGEIINYCEENEIRFRAVWMPWNAKYEQPACMGELRERTDNLLAEHDIYVHDLENEIETILFYDITHMDYDTGAPWFTELMDRWL